MAGRLAAIGLLSALALPLFPTCSFAAGLTTLDLYNICNKSDPGSEVACKFYVLGAAEGAEASWMSGQRKPLFCIPDGVSFVTMAHAFVADIAQRAVQRPDVGGVAAVVTLLDSMEHTYPCSATDSAPASVSSSR